MKLCSACQTVLSASEFYKNRRKPDGLHSECKRCAIARARRWNVENPERTKAHMLSYYYRRRGSSTERPQGDQPSQKVAKVQRLRARYRGLEEHYTASEWDTLLLCTGGVCAACGRVGKLEVDHVVPLSVGGSNTIDNLQPLCKPCNARKGAQTVCYL